MKKNLCALCALFCLALGVVAQDAPAFTGENAEFAMIVDLNPLKKKVKDNVVLVNQATTASLSFVIYVFDKKHEEWLQFGSGRLNGFNDTDKVGATLTGDVKKYPYVAVVPTEGVKYSFKTGAHSHDLYFFVQPENNSFEAFKESAVECDVSHIHRFTKDNIRFVSNSAKIQNTGFYVFADSGEGYSLVGSAYLKGLGDTCFVHRADDIALTQYNSIAIVSTDGGHYEFSVNAESNDLYVYVEDFATPTPASE